MAATDLRQLTTTTMASTVNDYSVNPKQVDEASGYGETYWDSPNWTKYLGYYKTIPELKKSVDALACWTAGKGWTADIRTTNILSLWSGWGEDTSDSLFQNMIIVKKINGDSFAEIMWSDAQIRNFPINLKPLNPSNVRIVVSPKGRIIRYDVRKADGTYMPMDIRDIFHLSNDRIANEIHGTSIVEACQWIIDAKNEAMADKRRILHRSTIRIIEVDSDDATTLSTLNTQYSNAIKNGEVLIVPKDNVGFPNVPPLSTLEHSDWIRYCDNDFPKSVGVPTIILGGSEQVSEGSNKMSAYNFEQVYMAEQRLLEQDIKAQLKLEIKFERPNSLQENMQSNEAKNTSQTEFQPKDFQITGGRE